MKIDALSAASDTLRMQETIRTMTVPQAARAQMTPNTSDEPGSRTVCLSPSIQAHSRIIPSTTPQARTGEPAWEEKRESIWFQTD